MKSKFVYVDNSNYPPAKVIFEYVADSILEADKAYEDVTGQDPVKQSHIGCQIHLITAK